MNVRNKRTRVVFARILDRDYAELERMCAIGGSASISDLIREAIRALIEHRNFTDSRACSGCEHVQLQLDQIRVMLAHVEVPNVRPTLPNDVRLVSSETNGLNT